MNRPNNVRYGCVLAKRCFARSPLGATLDENSSPGCRDFFTGRTVVVPLGYTLLVDGKLECYIELRDLPCSIPVEDGLS